MIWAIRAPDDDRLIRIALEEIDDDFPADARNAYDCSAGGGEDQHNDYRPQRLTPRPAIGTQTAVVVGPAGEEIFTDKYGRVKVQFHWDRQGKNDANSSAW